MLECLSVSGDCSSIFLEHVENYFRTVSELKLFFVQRGMKKEVSNLILSYSAQIMKLDMRPSIVNPFQLDTVSQLSPLADFSMACTWAEVCCVMDELKDRLVCLAIFGEQKQRGDELDYGFLIHCVGGCSRLQKIVCSFEDEDDCEPMEVILYGACESLHELNVEIMVLAVPTGLRSETFDWACSLRKFRYQGRAADILVIWPWLVLLWKLWKSQLT